MKNESAIQLWEEYKEINRQTPEDYDVWAFGNSKAMADELAELVLSGIKTATASNYILYELENEKLPYPGLFNIILNGNEEAVAIIETTDIEIIPFNKVTEEHAYLEGEGDRSLDYWRDVHEKFFEEEFSSINQTFDETMLVVCERFKVVYTKETNEN
ncbi:ASCH domain-containing protein [Pseudogracilibacillus sp. SE30717A]|uniref:ASCH domain-containing protein n=1 Tax=Pseudogracilibacillus sp. SE30717A TaxID=3098293 RepID=UPI00300E09D2